MLSANTCALHTYVYVRPTLALVDVISHICIGVHVDTCIQLTE